MSGYKSDFLNILATRGFIHQVSEPDALDKLADELGAHIRPQIRRVYPLEAAADAHRDLEAGGISGKLVLAVGVAV